MFNKSKDNLTFIQLLSQFGEVVDNEQSLFHGGTTSFPNLPLFTNNHFNKLWQKLLCKISNIDTIEFQIYGVCTIMIALNHQTKTPIGFGVGRVQTTSFPDLPLFTINHFNKLWQKLLCRISNIDTIEFHIYGVCTILIALNHQIKTPIAFGVGKVQTLHQCHKLIGY